MIRLHGHQPFLRTLLLTLILAASALAGGRALAADTLILTDGMKTGTLEGCSGGACSFDGAAVPRASIYFIGLDAEPPAPQPQDYTRDEVHLRDGSVHPGPLLSIDADNVVTASASHAREDVAWIWLTPLTPGDEGQGPAAPSTTTSDGNGEAEANEDRPTYLWEGTIRVENRYNDPQYGRHHWQAEYRVKFLEATERPYRSPDNGRLISNNGLEPLEFGYAYHAEQLMVWPDSTYTVILRGQAIGHWRRGEPSSSGIGIEGTIWGIHEPWADLYRAPSAFASSDEAGEYGLAQVAASPEPGWYQLTIAIWGSEAERRTLYNGIERGGTAPVMNGPDRAVLDYIPNCMPIPTWIVGRLDRPDQSEVRGRYTYPRGSGSDTPMEITIEWSFTRRASRAERRGVPPRGRSGRSGRPGFRSRTRSDRVGSERIVPEGIRMIRLREHLPLLRTLLLALILAASALAAGRALAEDMLILTDGGLKTGTLEGCAGGACSFDGAAVPRASIYFIGLDAELPVPQPQDYTRDEVHLRDGSVHPGPLVTIDADDVVTESASHAREDVAWIWLTPLTPGEEGQGEAAPSTTTSDGDGEAEADKDRPTYLWEGTIRVENRYNDAKYGRHHWQAEYRVKFREVVWEDPYPSSDNGRPISNNGLEPLELAYAYRADQAWQVWLRDDLMETITIRGAATGHSQGDGSSNGLVLSGTIWGLYEPWAEAHQGPTSFASLDEAGSYANDRWVAAPEPGWYHLVIEARGTEAERRALYAGIERGGSLPIYSHPDRDFLDYVPVCMPGPTWVTGRLDRPDQAEVSGGFTYPYRSGDDTSQTPNEITVEWSFTRKRQ